MPPVLGPASPSQQALVVLGHRQQLDVAPVGDGQDRDLLALEERLDHDGRAGVAEGAARPAWPAPRAAASARVAQTIAPLPAARPDALTTSGSAWRST